MRLPSVLLLQEHITRHAAADTIPTNRATRALVAVIERSVIGRGGHRSGAGVGCLAGANAPELRGRTGWRAIVLNPTRTMSGWGQTRKSSWPTPTSALPLKADIRRLGWHVRNVPTTELAYGHVPRKAKISMLQHSAKLKCGTID